MNTQDDLFAEHTGFTAAVPRGPAAAVPEGFTIEDVLWTLGIWSVIIGLSPVIVFYVLMVA